MEDISGPKPEVHILVCTNDREGKAPSCCPSIKNEDVKAVKLWIREQGWTGKIQCTKTGCLGFCNEQGGVMMVHPTKRIVKGLRSSEDIKEILLEEKKKLNT